MKLAMIVGSLRADSYNKQLAQAIAKRLDADDEVVWVSADVPLFNQDLEPDNIPEPVQRAVDQINWSDVVFFVSPEYNRSFSGVIKNLMDWLSRESVGYPLDEKIGAVAGATESGIGTAVMQSHIRPSLAHIGMDLVPLPELFVSVPDRMSESGELTERTAESVDLTIKRLRAKVDASK